MQAPFDLLAENYDHDFTETAIGRMQRAQVLKYLDSIEYGSPPAKLLEINGGTGTDALYFAKRGLNVTTTDISGKMVALATKKMSNEQLKMRIIQCNMLEIGSIFQNERFDLIFSNFGGLNCVSPADFKLFSEAIFNLLKPGGRFIGVIMPRFCIWDSLYFFSRLRFGKGTRRWWRKETLITIKGTSFPIWYYNPREFAAFFNNRFYVSTIKPIGLFIPPSYLNFFFLRHPKVLAFLGAMETRIENISFVSSLSDHYLIDLIKEG